MTPWLALAAAPVPSSGSGGSSHPWWAWLVGAIAIVAGIVFFIKPKLQWQMNRWQYKNPDALEPSAKGLMMARFSAVVMVAVGVVFLVVAATH